MAKPIKVQAPKQKTSSIRFIVDRSGSMGSIVNDVIGGFNTFIAEQRKLPDPAVVTFSQFDNQYEVVYSNKPLVEVEDLTTRTYMPRGGTALNDAIGVTLQSIPVDAIGETVVIMTDGEENSSTKFSTEQVKALVTEFQAKGNQVIFIGANIDSFRVGGNYGVAAAGIANFEANSMGSNAAFKGMSSKLGSTRTAYAAGVADWTDAGGTMADNYTRGLDDLKKDSTSAATK